ncbi:hypothetical protein HaLaN_19893 [Haematococcus lacustris]|uniref:Uncharacterized protein n=1 Tax=Haematococcus lacustris TaxID=44745 RepID=A0A699ZRU2_HAELA|nr:hypothetical protein HaLaN_19893 [Haematococcus lacustris]
MEQRGGLIHRHTLPGLLPIGTPPAPDGGAADQDWLRSRALVQALLGLWQVHWVSQPCPRQHDPCPVSPALTPTPMSCASVSIPQYSPLVPH